MPKRKASQSIDEWLEEGLTVSGTSRGLPEIHSQQTNQFSPPTAEGPRPATATDCPTETIHPRAAPVHVATTADEVAGSVATTHQAEVAVDVIGPVTIEGGVVSTEGES